MTAGLETFAKVRALHDRTDSPGEKAAAAGRMDALARAAGMTTAEAVSKLDRAAARPGQGVDWAAFAEDFWRAEAAKSAAAAAPEALSRRRGLPIYDADRIESWSSVAQHCVNLDWIIPKACGGKFLTKDERARLKAVAGYAPITNATADWIETVLARCMAAREAWLDRDRPAGMRSERKPAASGTTGATTTADAASDRVASSLDTPPHPQPRSLFQDLFDTPEFRARKAERDQRDAEHRAAVLAEVGSEDAVWAETEREVALERACRPVVVRKPITGGETDTLMGWDGGRLDGMPPAVREVVSGAYPLPSTVREAWSEFSAWEKLTDDRCAFCPDYSPGVRTRARTAILEYLLDTLPAGDVQDLRARLDWMQHVLDLGSSRDIHEDQACLTALRADVERVAARAERAASAETSAEAPEAVHEPPASAVQTGQRPSTRAERRAAVRALLGDGLPDREIARRVGVSPSTVAAVRRAGA